MIRNAIEIFDECGIVDSTPLKPIEDGCSI